MASTDYDYRVITRQSGFTIVEILVVVAIIGVLATAVAINVTGYLAESRKERVKMDLATLKNAVELRYLQRQQYPTNDQGLAILVQATASHPHGIIGAIPLDPWGNPYDYRYPGQHGVFDIICFARDGTPGGEGEDADIGSWELNAKLTQ